MKLFLYVFVYTFFHYADLVLSYSCCLITVSNASATTYALEQLMLALCYALKKKIKFGNIRA